jgi:hypothetical protein
VMSLWKKIVTMMNRVKEVYVHCEAFGLELAATVLYIGLAYAILSQVL